MRRTLLVPPVLLFTCVVGPAAHGGEAVPDLLPVEVTVDPPEPVQGDDVTISVTAEVPDTPECAEIMVAVVVRNLGDAEGLIQGISATPATPVDGQADATEELTSAIPGQYGVYATCADQAPTLDSLPNQFGVTAGPDFVMAVADSTGAAGAAGTVTVTGGACWTSPVSVALLAEGESLDTLDTGTWVDVAADGSWTTDLTWPADAGVGNYTIQAVCGDLTPREPTQRLAYDPIDFSLQLIPIGPPGPPPPATPVPAPADFTG